MSLIDKIFGDYSSKQIKKITPAVDKIEALAGEYATKSDEELRAMTDVFRQRLSEGETLGDACYRKKTVPRTAHGRYYTSSGANRGDEDG